MPTIPLPENPSLEHLKSQGKLVRDLIRSGDPGGLSMIDEFHPRMDAAELDEQQRASFKTTDAQLIVARLYGFASWNRLRDHLGTVTDHIFTPVPERPGWDDDPLSFIENACLDYAEAGPSPATRVAAAHRQLDADPSLASGSIAALATVGDHEALAELLDERPASIDEPCGPNDWPPLSYAAYSRIATDEPRWSLLRTVELLLDRGADPNAGFLWRGLVPPFTALTGALDPGENRERWPAERLAIARLLLEAGADPNDGQGLYNNGIGGQRPDDPADLELLVEFGLGTQQDGPWYERLGGRLRDPAELLYDELEAAVKRNRPVVLGYLISLGLDLERPIGRSQLPPARIAAAEGHDRIFAVLRDAGIEVAMSPTEQALSHSRTNAVEPLRRLLDDNPDLLDALRTEQRGLCRNVAADHADMLGYLIELGFDINDRSDTKTALHHAAEAGETDRARLLIEHGADPNLVDAHIGAAPWGWANYFDHPETARYLEPLTRQDGEPLPEFTITDGRGGTERVLVTPALIEAVLDDIQHRADPPVLVGLRTKGGSLTVGLGHPEHAVALYLDSDGTPWHATAEQPGPIDQPIEFAQGTVTRSFERAAIAPDHARAIARDFITSPDSMPATGTWVREGGDG